MGSGIWWWRSTGTSRCADAAGPAHRRGPSPRPSCAAARRRSIHDPYGPDPISAARAVSRPGPPAQWIPPRFRIYHFANL